MSDLQTLIELACERMFRDKRPVKHTLTGGTSTTVVNSNQAYTSWSANQFDRIGVYMLSADDAAPEGEYRQVTDGGFDSSDGTWTVAPAYSGTPASGDTALMMYGPDIQELLEAFSEVKKGLYLRRYLPFTLVRDGNMEKDGVSDFTVSGPTAAKVTNTVLTGTQALQLTSSAGTCKFHLTFGGDNNSDGIYPGVERMYVSVVMNVIGGLADVNVVAPGYDETIDPPGANLDAQWLDYRFEVDTDTSESGWDVEVTIDKENGAVIVVDHVSVWSGLRRRYSTETRPEHIERVFTMPRGQPATHVADGVYVPFQGQRKDIPISSLRDYHAVHDFVEFDPSPDKPFYEFRANESAYTNLDESDDVATYHAQTTNIPDEIIVTGALAYLQRKGSFVDSFDHTQRYFHLLDDLSLAKPTLRTRGSTRTPVMWR